LKWFEPEIHQLLLELAIAVNRAQHFRFGQFVLNFLRIARWRRVDALRRMRERLLLFAIVVLRHARAFRGHVGRRILVLQRLGRKLQHWQIGQARVHRGIVDRFRMKLLLDPCVEPALLDPRRFSRSRSKPKPVERVQHGLFLIEVADRQLAGEVASRRGRFDEAAPSFLPAPLRAPESQRLCS